jgi:hypothetical protein
LSTSIKQLRPTNPLGIPIRPPKTSTETVQLSIVRDIFRPPRPAADPVVNTDLVTPDTVSSAEINSEFKKTEVTELLDQGKQLLSEMSRQHCRLRKAAEGALKPDPPAWRNVRAAKTDHDAAYAELIQLSKQLNRMVQTDAPS